MYVAIHCNSSSFMYACMTYITIRVYRITESNHVVPKTECATLYGLLAIISMV